jgi:hypothetical protein
MKKVAVVDVDSTLWEMGNEIYEHLKIKHPNLETPDQWDEWDFYEKYGISKKEFFNTVDEIHAYQYLYKPYKYASLLTQLLGEYYHVIIASHRKPKNKRALEIWLEDWGIYYNEIFVGCEREGQPPNKFHLFENAGIVIDDSPVFCVEAAKRGAEFICGIQHAWNEELKDTFLFAKDVKDLIVKLDELNFIMRGEINIA